MRLAKTNNGEALLQADESQAAAVPSKETPKPGADVETCASRTAEHISSQPLRKRVQALIKRFLPADLSAGLRVVAELKSVSPSAYKRLGSVVRAWGRAGQRPRLASQVRRVVFVCHGNIMRSPTAEAMLRTALAKQSITNVTVISAGLHATDGRSADPRAQTVAPEFGISLRGHSAQLVTERLINSSDLVIVMDIQNAAEFLLRYPEASERLFMLRQFSDQSRGPGKEIPDPYPGNEGDMRCCCGMLRECVEGLTELLARQSKS